MPSNSLLLGYGILEFLVIIRKLGLWFISPIHYGDLKSESHSLHLPWNPTFLSTLFFGEWRGKPLQNLAASGIVSLCYYIGLFCYIDDFIIRLWHLNWVYITLCTMFNVLHKMSHPIYHASTISFCALHWTLYKMQYIFYSNATNVW